MKNPLKAKMFVYVNGKEAKSLGRSVKLREDWDLLKEEFMYTVCFAKFTQNKNPGKKLLATGDRVLIEGNAWGDTEWGVCNGVGKKLLGEILMEIREKIKN